MKVLIEHFHEIMNRLEVVEIVVENVHTDAEVQPGIATIHDLEVPVLERASER
jgi:hypothetical protein